MRFGPVWFASAYVDHRALRWVLYGTAQDFVRQGRRISVSQKDKAHDIDEGTHVGPVEVDVGNTSGGAVEMNEERGNGIGNRRAARMQHAVGTFAKTLYGNVLCEVRRIAALHLEEVDGVVMLDAMQSEKFE